MHIFLVWCSKSSTKNQTPNDDNSDEHDKMNEDDTMIGTIMMTPNDPKTMLKVDNIEDIQTHIILPGERTQVWRRSADSLLAGLYLRLNGRSLGRF